MLKKYIPNFGGKTFWQICSFQDQGGTITLLQVLGKLVVKAGERKWPRRVSHGGLVLAALNLRNVLQYNEFINWTN
jgi:hypothetical protein